MANPRHCSWLFLVSGVSGWRVAGLGALGLAVLAGCSSGSRTETRLRSLAVEPELPAATTSACPLQPIGGVPDVIPPPRPFRAADLLAADELSVGPATLAATVDPLPPEPRDLPGLVAPVSAIEPVEEPAPLPAASEDVPSRAAIRAMFDDYQAAFNRHDAAALVAHWTADGESRNLDTGERTEGREAVHGVFETLFESDARADLDVDITSIRPVRADVAVVDGLTRIGSASGASVSSRFTAVVVQEEGRWLLESMREAAVEAAAPPPRPLDELAWLVGFWEDDAEGLTAGGRCDWTTGRGFLVRQHTVTPDSGPRPLPKAGDEGVPALLPVGSATRTELTELIGWDPDRQEIRSWLFTADGRFAEATWQRAGEGWSILVEGQGSDAGREARCTLLQDGPDRLVIQCDGGGIEGLMPPACSFLRTAR